MDISQFNPLIRYISRRRGGEKYGCYVLAYDHRFFYTCTGYVTVSCENTKYILKEGEALILPPGTKYMLDFSEDAEYFIMNFDFVFDESKKDVPPTSPEPPDLFSENKIISKETSELFPLMLSCKTDGSGTLTQMHDSYIKKDFMYREFLSASFKSYVIGSLIFTKYDHTPKTVKSVLEYIGRSYLSDISNSDIAEVFSFHPNYLNKLFKTYTGKTIHAYINELRLQKAEGLLLTTELDIGQISDICNFDSYSYFIKCFKKYSGLSPKKYRTLNRKPL